MCFAGSLIQILSIDGREYYNIFKQFGGPDFFLQTTYLGTFFTTAQTVVKAMPVAKI